MILKIMGKEKSLKGEICSREWLSLGESDC